MASTMVAVIFGAGPAHAEQSPSAVQASEPAVEPDRWEPTAIPAFNYDSDIGLGLGFVGALARFDEGYNPFRFRGELQLFASIRRDASGRYDLSQHNHYFRTDLPGLGRDRLRLVARVGFLELPNRAYYGLGAASRRTTFSAEALKTSEEARRYHQYGRAYAYAEMVGRIRLLKQPTRKGKRRLELIVGAAGGYSWMTVYPESKLAEDVMARDVAPDAGVIRQLLFGTRDHALLILSSGLLWDSRDHEFAPSRGNLTELSVQLAPGVDQGLRYARLHFGTSFYAPLHGDSLVIASRALCDNLVGHPPLYELAAFGVLNGGDGPGGSQSVRGVLRQRYHGRIKAIGNLELRASSPRFSVRGARFRVGAVAFVDAGRLWADVGPSTLAGRDLDRIREPFDLGLGGGLRLQWGEAFVLRSDGAYSPTDRTSGFYVDLGHTF